MVTNIEYAFQFRARRVASVDKFELPEQPTKDTILELLDSLGFVAVRYNPYSIANNDIVKDATALKIPVYMVGPYDDSNKDTHWIRFCDGNGNVLVFLRTTENAYDYFSACITDLGGIIGKGVTYTYLNHQYKEFRHDCESVVRLALDL